MGDGSSRRNLNATDHNQQLSGSSPIEARPTCPEVTGLTPHRISVIYSHKKAEQQMLDEKHAHECCDSFDELLAFLEDDLVETIWFDASVTPQERSYITGWAKIFRPELTVHILPSQKNLH